MKEHKENISVHVSIPLEYGEVQAAHDVLKNLFEDGQTRKLQKSAKYLVDMAEKAALNGQPHDSSVLADLAGLALNLVEDSLDKNK